MPLSQPTRQKVIASAGLVHLQLFTLDPHQFVDTTLAKTEVRSPFLSLLASLIKPQPLGSTTRCSPSPTSHDRPFRLERCTPKDTVPVRSKELLRAQMDGGAHPTQLAIDIAVVLYAHHSPLAPDAPPQSPRPPHPSTISGPSSAPFAPATAPIFFKTINAIHNLKYPKLPPLPRTAAMHGCTDAGIPNASSCASSTSPPTRCLAPRPDLRHYEAFS